MTLFERAAGEDGVFRQCLLQYFGGQADPLTLALL